MANQTPGGAEAGFIGSRCERGNGPPAQACAVLGQGRPLLRPPPPPAFDILPPPAAGQAEQGGDRQGPQGRIGILQGSDEIRHGLQIPKGAQGLRGAVPGNPVRASQIPQQAMEDRSGLPLLSRVHRRPCQAENG